MLDSFHPYANFVHFKKLGYSRHGKTFAKFQSVSDKVMSTSNPPSVKCRLRNFSRRAKWTTSVWVYPRCRQFQRVNNVSIRLTPMSSQCVDELAILTSRREILTLKYVDDVEEIHVL